jgi:hypothetical protein
MGGRGEKGSHDCWLFVSAVRGGSDRQIRRFVNRLGGGEGKAFGLTPTSRPIRREKPLASSALTVPQTDTEEKKEKKKKKKRPKIKLKKKQKRWKKIKIKRKKKMK